MYEPSSCQERKSGRDMENERIRILFERQKEQLLAEVRTEIQKHKLEAESDRRSIQELNGINESQRREIDHTIASDEKLRRDQLLHQEQLSEQNRDLREICIRNMRDMEELQKTHVLKVEELSRRKLTEDFEEVTSFSQGSNVKTVYNLGDKDAKYPDAEIDDEHARNWWLHHCTFRSEKQVRAFCRFFTHREKACFNVHCQFLASTGKPVTGCDKKRKANQELENCQIWIIFWKDKGTVARRSKIRDLETWLQSADRERALRDTRIGSIQKLEELKGDQEFRLEEFPRRRMVENHSKYVESVRSGQLFHVPSQPALFPLPREPGGLLCRVAAKYLVIRMVYQETFVDGLHASASTTCSGMLNSMDFFVTGKYSGASKYGEARNRRWWSRPQPILSQNGYNPKQFLNFQF